MRNKPGLNPERYPVRRFFQFRLRTILAFMGLCSFAFAWIGANLRQWQAEQHALAAIGPASIDYSSSLSGAPIFR